MEIPHRGEVTDALRLRLFGADSLSTTRHAKCVTLRETAMTGL